MKSRKSGFTLIELLISITILSAIMISFTFLIKTSMHSLASSKEYLKALYAAQSKMEQIRATSFDQIKPDSGITIRNFSSDLIEIKVKVNWDDHKAPIELITMRSKF